MEKINQGHVAGPSNEGVWAGKQPFIFKMKKFNIKNTIRYKIINGKKRPLCDHEGNCKNLAFKEVYPNLGKRKEDSGWRYLCKKYFEQEQKNSKEN